MAVLLLTSSAMTIEVLYSLMVAGLGYTCHIRFSYGSKERRGLETLAPRNARLYNRE
jgi:hypothetical protein